MTRIIILQHSPYEPLGMIVPTLRKMKIRIRYVNFYRNPRQRIDISRYHGLVVLGGSMNPDQLEHYPHLLHEIELIQDAILKDIPVLGICLGSQLLNLALGGSCYALPKPEFGWSPLNKCADHPLFKTFQPPSMVFQWHQYASHPAPNCEVILDNQHCIQAFSYQKKHMGLQFHLEIDTHLIRRWLEHPDYLEHLEAHIDRQEIERIRKASALHLHQSITMATDFFAEFFYLLNQKQYLVFSNR